MGDKADLLQALVAEHYVEATHLQKRWVDSTCRCTFLLVGNGLAHVKSLGRGGDVRYQVCELSAEFFDAGGVDLKENIGLGLAGKTSSDKGEH